MRLVLVFARQKLGTQALQSQGFFYSFSLKTKAPGIMPSRPEAFKMFSLGGGLAVQRQLYDARRGTTAQRGYGSKWRRIRAKQLDEHPLCKFHLEKEETKLATEVDHIDGNSRNNKKSNLRSLCKSCHSSRTARDQGFAKRKGNTIT